MSTTPTAPPGSGGSESPESPGSPGGPDDRGPRVSTDEIRDLTGLRRTVRGAPEGRHIAGVAGGLARHFDIDPIVIRIALVVLVFFGGAGLLLYAAGWLLIPEEESGHSVVRMDARSRNFVLYIAAALALLAILSDTVGGYHFPWPLLVVGLVVLVVLGRRGRLLRWSEAAQSDWASRTGAGKDASGTGPVDLAKHPRTGVDHELPAGEPPTSRLPRDPRKRGPRLFGPTIAAVALAEGILGLADVAGADIADPAYPALAVGIIGAALVLGSLWGRAGGLVALGLVGTLALVGSVAAQEWDVTARHISIAPYSAAGLDARYEFDLGDAKIDLTRIPPAELDGRTLTVDGDVGSIRIVVPDGVEVRARGSVDGPGEVQVFDQSRGGFDSSLTRTRSAATASTAAPVLTVDATLDVGRVQILDDDDPDAGRSNR